MEDPEWYSAPRSNFRFQISDFRFQILTFPTFSVPYQERARRNVLSPRYSIILGGTDPFNRASGVEPTVSRVGKTDIHSTAFPVLGARVVNRFSLQLRLSARPETVYNC
jgi:hypothetical protein